MTGTQQWSVAGNWSPGGPPAGGTATVLRFGGTTTNDYTANNNLSGTFVLNRLELSGGSASATADRTYTGSPLQFAGTDPRAMVGTDRVRHVLDNDLVFAATTTFDGTVSSGNSNRLALSGQLSGAGGVTVAGVLGSSSTSLFEITTGAANSYLGTTTVTGGATLKVSSNARLGPGAVTLDGGRLVVGSGNLSDVRQFNLVGLATTNFLDLPGSTVRGRVRGTGGITISSGGSALTEFGDTANDYTGETILDRSIQMDGTYTLGSPASGTVLLDTRLISLSSTGTVSQPYVVAEPLSVGNTSTTITQYSGSLRSVAGVNTWSGPITLRPTAANTPAAFSANDDTALTVSGVVSGGRLRTTHVASDTGTGMIRLTNANAYSGGTLIQAYTLASNTSGSATGTGPVVIEGGGGNQQGVLGGTGSVAGVVSGNGTIRPGDPFFGAISSRLTLAGGLDPFSGRYLWRLGSITSAVPGTDFDQLVVDGSLKLAAGSRIQPVMGVGLENNPGTTPLNPFWQSSHSWKVLDFVGAGPYAETFEAVEFGTYASGSFTQMLSAGDILIVWTPVPEPAAVLALAAAGLAIRRRVGARRSFPT